jgi:hypothetical protein
MKYYLVPILMISICPLFAQDMALPYYEIPAAPEAFTAGAVASRMIDGLGFRYYWATDGLRPEDLNYKPGVDTRTSEETLRHIHELSFIIVNSVTQTPNVPGAVPKLLFAEMRKRTLENLKTASDRLRTATDADLEQFKLVFKRDSNSTEFSFWNQLNGPIADCLWHVGQVVSFRRASGNPFTEKASVFTGTVRK